MPFNRGHPRSLVGADGKGCKGAPPCHPVVNFIEREHRPMNAAGNSGAGPSFCKYERCGPCGVRVLLLRGAAGYFFLKVLLQGFEVEARTFLHRRELEHGLRRLCDPVLYKDKTPELIGIPVVEGQ